MLGRNSPKKNYKRCVFNRTVRTAGEKLKTRPANTRGAEKKHAKDKKGWVAENTENKGNGSHLVSKRWFKQVQSCVRSESHGNNCTHHTRKKKSSAKRSLWGDGR